MSVGCPGVTARHCSTLWNSTLQPIQRYRPVGFIAPLASRAMTGLYAVDPQRRQALTGLVLCMLSLCMVGYAADQGAHPGKG